jgi:hypothetical protein
MLISSPSVFCPIRAAGPLLVLMRARRSDTIARRRKYPSGYFRRQIDRRLALEAFVLYGIDLLHVRTNCR